MSIRSIQTLRGLPAQYRQEVQPQNPSDNLDWVPFLPEDSFPDDMSISSLTQSFEPGENALATLISKNKLCETKAKPTSEELLDLRRRCTVLIAIKHALNPSINGELQDDLIPDNLGDLRSLVQNGKLEGIDGFKELPGDKRSREILRKLLGVS